MKKLGIALIAMGLIVAVFSLGFDTTVLTQGGDRVHNIGLMQQNNSLFLFSIALFVVGVILWAAATLASKSDDATRERKQAQPIAFNRPLKASLPAMTKD